MPILYTNHMVSNNELLWQLVYQSIYCLNSYFQVQQKVLQTSPSV